MGCYSQVAVEANQSSRSKELDCGSDNASYATSFGTQWATNFGKILAKLIPPKQHSSVSPVIAGPKPTKQTFAKTDPFQTHDPWARYQGPNTNGTPQQPRDVAGPTEAKFQQQESRILQVEQAIQKLQQDTKAGFVAVEQREKSFQNALQTDLHAMRKDIDTSVQKALMAQSSKLDNTLSELKSLFAQGRDSDFDAAMDSPAK